MGIDTLRLEFGRGLEEHGLNIKRKREMARMRRPRETRTYDDVATYHQAKHPQAAIELVADVFPGRLSAEQWTNVVSNARLQPSYAIFCSGYFNIIQVDLHIVSERRDAWIEVVVE